MVQKTHRPKPICRNSYSKVVLNAENRRRSTLLEIPECFNGVVAISEASAEFMFQIDCTSVARSKLAKQALLRS